MTIYVGNLSFDAEREDLVDLFGQYGQVRQCSLPLDRETGRKRGFAFVELSAEIEKFAGCTVAEIQALYGQSAYRRYERRALEEAIQIYPEVVIATPGGLVSDPSSFNELLTHCTTIWLKASPEDHMKRVMAQGDNRPMAASKEAMADLKSILAAREAFYAKANFTVDTSQQALNETFLMLLEVASNAMRRI